MSREVDERVVSMQFDNRHFESNVKTTMSTLDKLKAKLHLPGAAKGLEDVGHAAKKVNLSSIGSAAETVGLKFNAMYTIADQALRNMTNSAMAAGKRIVNALTIDPVKTGFKEYELKMDSVKTIMASTGESIETVNKYLKELNEYSDQTIYSFSDMTQNIGKFTNAGVKLEDAVLAIKGISNEAALSGANANEASRAMYNFAQALSVGYIQRIDWKSIELANMATQEFKNELLNAAIAAGTVKKNTDGMYETLAHPGKAYNASAMFTETLDDQWLTTEVLIETLKDYSDATTDIGKRAYSAAQDVTKLSQMFDVLKETAQSGWANTWELIFGDLNQAKAIFTPLTDFFSKVINRISDARNTLLQSALGKSFKSLMEPLKGLKKTMSTITEPIKAVTKTLEDYNAVVKEVIRGDWGHTKKRWDALTEAGYDWVTVQNMVNEELGCSLRRQTDFVIGQSEVNKSTEEAVAADNAYIASLTKLTDAELKDRNLKEDQIKAIRDIQKEADRLGLSVEDFLANIDELDGRWVLINSFKNLGKGLVTIFRELGAAWRDVFSPADPDKLYGLIAGFHKLSVKFNEFANSIKSNDEKAGKLRRTFAGLFAIIDIITTVTGGAFKMAFKVITGVLGAFNLDILDVTAAIGDVLVKMSDWIEEHNIFTKGAELLVPIIKKVIAVIKEWFSVLSNGHSFGEAFTAGFEAIKDWIKDLKEADNIPKYILQGLVAGLKAGASAVYNTIIEIGKKLLESIKKVLGIHSPSREFMEIGKNIAQGLLNGLKSGALFVLEFIKTLGVKCLEMLKDLSLDKLISAAISGGIIYSVVKVTNTITELTGALKPAMQGFGNMLNGIGNMFNGLGSFLTDFGAGLKKNLKASAMEKYSKALLNMAIAIGILVIAIIALSKMEWSEIGKGLAVLGILAGAMLLVAFAAKKIGSIPNLGKQTLSIMGLSIAMYILASVLAKLSDLDITKWKEMSLGMILIIGGLVIALQAINKLGAVSANAKGVGSMLLKFSIALLILVGVIKLISGLRADELFKGLVVIYVLELIVQGLVKVSANAGQYASKAGSLLLKFSIALLILVGVIKLISGMEIKELIKGVAVIYVLELLVGELVRVTQSAGANASKAGSLILKFSIAMLILVGVIKLIGMMDAKELIKGLIVVGVLEMFAAGLIEASRVAGKNAAKAGVMLIMMAGAIAILAGVIFLLSVLSAGSIAKGMAIITLLEAFFIGLVAVTAIAKDSDNMVSVLGKIIIVIALLTVSVVALSFIEPKRLAGAVAALTLLMGAFALIIAMTKFSGTVNIKTLIGIIAILTILSAIVALMTFTNVDKALKSSAAVATLLTSFAASMALIGKAGTINASVKKNILPMLGVVGALAILLGIMGGLDVNASIATATAIGILLDAFAASIMIIGKAGSISPNAIDCIMDMLIVVSALAAILAIMDVLDAEASISSAIAMGVLLNAFAASILVISKANGASMPASSTILVMLGVASALGVLLGILAGLDCQPSIESSIALSTLLIGFSAALLILSKVGPLATGAIAAAGALIAVIAIIGAFIAALGGLDMLFDGGVSDVLVQGIEVLALIGKGIGKFIGAIVEGIAESIMGILPTLGESLSSFMKKAQPFIDMAEDVSEDVIFGVGYLTAAILALSAASFISGMNSLIPYAPTFEELGKNLTEFGKAVIPFVTTAQGIKPEMLEGVGILSQIIYILGAAGIMDGIASIIAGESSIPKFAKQMPLLGEGLRGFMDNIGIFSEDEKSTVSCAAEAVKKLAQAAEAIPNTGGLLGSIVGDNDMDVFADMFPVLGTGLRKFLDNVGTFTDQEIATVDCASEAVKSLASAAKEIPNTGGLLADFVGDNDLDDFANMFPVLGTGLKFFLQNIGTFTEEEQGTVKCAAEAVKTLAAASKEIPNTGGLLAKLVGDNPLDKFASMFPKVGTGIKGLLTNLGTFTEDEIATVNCAAESVLILAKVAKAIPNTGGLLAKLVGDNDLGKFASKIPQVGSGLRGFANKIGTFTEAQLASVDLAVQALVAIVQLANLDFDDTEDSFKSFINIVPKLGAVMPEFAKVMVDACAVGVNISVAGLNMIHSAGVKLADVIKAMPSEGFANVFMEVGTFKFRLSLLVEAFREYSVVAMEISSDGLKKGTLAGESVAALIDKLPSNFTNMLVDAYTFKSRLIDFAEGIKGFMNATSGVDIGKLNTITNNLEPIMEKFSTIGQNGFNKFSESFKSKAPDLNKAINDMLTTAYQAMEQHVNKFIKAGGDLGDGFVKGIGSKSEDVSKKAKALGDSSVTSITAESFYTDFYNAGASVAEGFANGISDNTYKATAKAAAMAAAAYEKAKEELDVNSPSKIFRKLGYSVPEGFAMGIDKMGDMVDKSAVSMASSAISSARNAIGRIVDIINGNMDVQPTIRPVMDLSDITAGAGVINGMFGRTPSLGLRANVGSITSMMNNRQNGGNNDVVSAIDSLKDVIGKSSGNTYSIGGITYDDGSVIAAAVQEIIRATRIEGRR